MNYTKEGWKKFVLREPISEIVFDPLLVQLSRTEVMDVNHYLSDSLYNLTETGGILGGFLVKDTFYPFTKFVNRGTGGGAIPLYKFNPVPVEMGIMEALAEQVQDFRTMMFHSHYRLTKEKMIRHFPESEGVLSFVQSEIDSGIHDVILKDFSLPLEEVQKILKYEVESQRVLYGSLYGWKLQVPKITGDMYRFYQEREKFDYVLNEVFSRLLSDEDIKNAVGDYHHLISPTINSNDFYSHLNTYRIISKSYNSVERISMRPPNRTEKNWFKEQDKNQRRITDECVRNVVKEYMGLDVEKMYSYSGEQMEDIWNFVTLGVLPLDHK